MKALFVTVGNMSYIQSAKSLESFVKKLPEDAIVEQTITISEMTGKLIGVPAINTSPLDNPFCEKMSKTDSICAKCYSCRMVSGIRKHCREGWKDNGNILSTRLLSTAEIRALHLESKAPFGIVRFSAHGELINYKHAYNLIKIAQLYPALTFGLWTKRLDILNEVRVEFEIEKPNNLVVIYSNPFVDKDCYIIAIQAMYPFVDKVFNVVSNNSDSVNCGARACATCKLCYSKKTTSVIIEKLR